MIARTIHRSLTELETGRLREMVRGEELGEARLGIPVEVETVAEAATFLNLEPDQLREMEQTLEAGGVYVMRREDGLWAVA